MKVIIFHLINNQNLKIYNQEIYQFDEDEIEIIKKSEDDIKKGRVISQEDLDKEDLEWLS
ncbi:hypothetical protein [Flavobacterium sp. IB48]|uniref:hypothetical protein n=1 Tax=Flavobacterium sp. IB48 TaxID=2779375 RepID=UPI0018E841E7|nr:hypothetical protein [Flavobacterium sp. IB48]MBJ2126223.1 hypothetical protein [Flavobacterium sp. IB48]